MSEKSKGDTSRQATTTTTSVVKNPLLSASVTGLTLDDFPNKPLLLPPVATSRESKSLVTVGSSESDIDNETLDEINLNTSSEETQPPAHIDSNANPLWDQNNIPTDSILSQAASSLSALPLVASSVLSTFSKRIYSSTSSREHTPDSNNTPGGDSNANIAPQLDIHPPYLHQPQQQQPPPQFYQQQQQQQQTPATAAASYYYPSATTADGLTTAGAFPQQQQQQPENTLDSSVPPPEPPKFYVPAEVPTLPAAKAAAPPTGAQNTYRLAAKKKSYAPIPGLSDQAATLPRLDSAASTAPLQFAPPQPPQPAQSVHYGSVQPAVINQFDQSPQPHLSYAPQAEREERKGLFSFTNLVPSGVLQNISGLVQSAAGTFTQNPAKAAEVAQSVSYEYPSVYTQPAQSVGGYFGAPSAQGPSVGVPPPLFYPSAVESAPQQSHIATNYTVPAPHFAAPPPQPQPSGEAGANTSAVVSPSPEGDLRSTTATQSIAPPPISGFIAAPPKSATSANIISTVECKASFDSSNVITPAKTAPSPFFNPVQLSAAAPSQTAFTEPPTTAANFFVPPSIFQPSQETQATTPIATEKAATPPTVASALGNVNILPPTIRSVPLSKPATPPLSQPIEATTIPTSSTYATTVGAFFNPTHHLSTSLTPPQRSAVGQPPAVAPTSANSTYATTVGAFFTPTNTPSATATPPLVGISPPPSHVGAGQPPTLTAKSTSSAYPSTLGQFITSTSTPTETQQNPQGVTVGAPPAAVVSSSSPPTQIVSAALPPPPAVIAPPPSGGKTSFRLQKGTRLYKSPLTSAETAPTYESPGNLLQSNQTTLNPLSSTVGASESNTLSQSASPVAALAPKPTPAHVSNYFIPYSSEPQSVALFAPELPSSESSESLRKFSSNSLFNVGEEETNLSIQESVKAEAAAENPPSQAEPVVTQVETKPSKDLLETSADATESAVANNNSNNSGTLFEQQTIEPEITEQEKGDDSLNAPTINLANSEVPDNLDKTLEKLALPTIEHTSVQTPDPAAVGPPQSASTIKATGEHINPFRKGVSSSVAAPQILANFFTPAFTESKSGDEFNFFATPSINTLGSPQPAVVPAVSQSTATELYQSTATESKSGDEFNFFATPSINTLGSPQPAVVPAVSQSTAVSLESIDLLPGTTTVLPPQAPTTTSASVNKLQSSATAAGFFAGEASNIDPFKQPTVPITPTSAPTLPVATPPPVAAATPSTSNLQSSATAAGFFTAESPHTDSLKQPINTEKQTEFPALPSLIAIAPPPLTQETATAGFRQPIATPVGIAPPLGFDNLVAQVTSAASTEPFATLSATSASSNENIGTVNSFSNFFNQSSNISKQQEENKQIHHTDPTSFFDSFTPPRQTRDSIAGSAPPAAEVLGESIQSQQQQQQQQRHQQQQTAQSNEDQRIQNFFNNPPPKENGSGVGDLNYDLVHRGLAVRNLPLRSLTPASNLAEPPSSSCSEFSELSSVGQTGAKVVPAESFIRKVPEQTTCENLITNNSPTKPLENTATDTGLTDDIVEKHYGDLPEEVLQELRMASASTEKTAQPAVVAYTPAVKHWFYKRQVCSDKYIWTPFSHYDSALLETTFAMGDDAPNIVAVEGGRYDVNIRERFKSAVYWEGEPVEVRRCSWFYKGTDSKYVPYEETTADLLEAEYKQAVESGEWHKKIILAMGEQVMFHGPTVIVHFHHQQSGDAWGGTSVRKQPTSRPRVVKRDLDDFTIDQGESQQVDHLLFMVHGIGSVCDLKMRSVEEVVDEFRSIAQQLVQSHYKNSTELGLVGRVEVLPISWYGHLHSKEMGIDEKLRSITLESIPKLRNFTNDTLLDVLFYTSPTYCQMIMTTVAASMNSVYRKYRERNPNFSGGVSLAGHSLGSLIVFDLLCHQKAVKESEENNLENPDQAYTQPETSGASVDTNLNSQSEIEAKQISYTMGPAGTGQPFIHYTQLVFQPKKFFALGSPIGMFVTIRGIDKLGLDFRLPTCSGFYNIFHPFDPVAYRIEALVNPDMAGIRPVLIPHHKGRKRMHLELKETMTRVGADLKQRFFDTFKNTLESINILGPSAKSKKETEETMKKEVDKVIAMQMELERQALQPVQEEDLELVSPAGSTLSPNKSRTRTDSVSTNHSDSDMVEVNFPLGKLNDSKRIDYVLQEAPLEFFNEYIFALSSHVCYWESEDTILFVMKEIYSGLGISPDSQVPQQTMTIERPSSRNSGELSPTT